MSISPRYFVKLIVIGILLIGLEAKALILELRPPNQNVSIGSLAVVDLWAVGSDITKGIGGYDLTVSFNPSILSFQSLNLSSALGITLGPTTLLAPGAVSVADVSLELPSDLLALQPNSDFLLGAFQFNTISMGTSLLDLSNVTLSDAFGDLAAVDHLSSGSITVTSSAINEPAVWLLLTIGMFSFASIRIYKS